MKLLKSTFLGFFLFLLVTPAVFAQETTIDTCPEPGTGGPNFSLLCALNPETAIPFVITAILVIAVVIALFFLIWGGIKWITSGGDKGAVDGARKTIIAAIIGLIVVFLAWFIINIILRFFTGGDISQSLSIPSVPSANSTRNGTDGNLCSSNGSEIACKAQNCSWIKVDVGATMGCR